MTQTIARTSLYESDLLVWTEDTIAKLRAKDFDHVDIDNLIEELESLANRDRLEVENRLIRLIEHILKRCYVKMPNDFRGWEVTIFGQRDRLKRKLKQSPSLKQHLLDSFDDCFASALQSVRIGYPQDQFPDTWQFERDIETILNAIFWE